MIKRIALLGMPNTGKSTFFNRLTGAGARVGNWPGITVDLLSAKILLASSMVEVVDLPGIYNLHGFSDDEQVVRHFLESQAVNGLVVILNATQLDRQLALLLQLKRCYTRRPYYQILSPGRQGGCNCTCIAYLHQCNALGKCKRNLCTEDWFGRWINSYFI